MLRGRFAEQNEYPRNFTSDFVLCVILFKSQLRLLIQIWRTNPAWASSQIRKHGRILDRRRENRIDLRESARGSKA